MRLDSDDAGKRWLTLGIGGASVRQTHNGGVVDADTMQRRGRRRIGRACMSGSSDVRQARRRDGRRARGGVEPSYEALTATRDLLIAVPDVTAAVEVLAGRKPPQAAVPAIR